MSSHLGAHFSLLADCAAGGGAFYFISARGCSMHRAAFEPCKSRKSRRLARANAPVGRTVGPALSPTINGKPAQIAVSPIIVAMAWSTPVPPFRRTSRPLQWMFVTTASGGGGNLVETIPMAFVVRVFAVD